MKRLLDWLDDRTGYRNLLNDMLFEPIPGGARWRLRVGQHARLRLRHAR